jgi:hypothetical protein
MAVEMERLKTLYEATNIKLQEQNNKYEAQQEELTAIKRMVAMIMARKQPSMGNNQEGDVLCYFQLHWTGFIFTVFMVTGHFSCCG